jgi:crossover junction endodeoxyribonuclease RuvC
MFESAPVLGVDPGLASTGLAVLDGPPGRPSLVYAGTLQTPSDLAEPQRLKRIYAGVRAVIAEHGVGTVAVEQVMWGKNVGSALRVARATGVLLLAAADAGAHVEEYAPLEVKMAVVGVGNAPKERVRQALARVHGISPVPTQPDAADAVAVALCHMQQSRIRRLTREAALR